MMANTAHSSAWEMDAAALQPALVFQAFGLSPATRNNNK